MDGGLSAILISFGIPAVIILFIFLWMKRYFGKQKKFADELRQRIANAKPATARVLSASHGMHGGDIRRLIFLKLEINDGFSSPYEANAGWFIDTLQFDKIKEGSEIPVKIDTANKYAIFPDVSWAVYTGGYSSDMSLENLQKQGITSL
jgi:hypothetical protein